MGPKTPATNSDHFRKGQIEQALAAPGTAKPAPPSPTDRNPGIGGWGNDIVYCNEPAPQPSRDFPGGGFIGAKNRSPKTVRAIVDPTDRFLIVFNSKGGNQRGENIGPEEPAGRGKP